MAFRNFLIWPFLLLFCEIIHDGEADEHPLSHIYHTKTFIHRAIMTVSAQGIQDLLKWAEENGCVHSDKLKFEYQEHRGVFAIATETHKAEKPQLKVPTRLIIHGGVAEKYFGKQLAVSETNLNGGLKLLWAKLKYDDETLVEGVNLNEFYKPYIALLPEGKETGSVFYWNMEELKLLSSTNLGGSLPAKFEWLVDEWFNTVSDLPEKHKKHAQYEQDLKFRDQFKTFTRSQLLDSLNNVTSWTSFGAYLWSTTIFTSRAFPHRIIDPSAKDGQAMFVPLIDLLNHKNSTLINWSYDQAENDGYFTMHNLDQIEAGGEVFNNYGAKGNEELLMGYGFVIENNANDSVALRVKPPFSAVLEAKERGVHIPKIDDYTYHAFATDEPQGDELTEDNYTGVLYFLNHKSLLPEDLIQMFMSLVSNHTEEGFTLRQRLSALQNLRKALEHKHMALKQDYDIDTSSIDPHVVKTAEIYRKGQMEVLKSTLSAIKSTEKTLLAENKSAVLSLKKLFKKDDRFRAGVSLFGINSFEELEDEEEEGDREAFFALWVLLNAEVPLTGEEDYVAPEWVRESYKQLKENYIPDDESVPYRMVQFQQAFKDHPLGKALTVQNYIIAERVVQMNSYTRGSADDVILVDPISFHV